MRKVFKIIKITVLVVLLAFISLMLVGVWKAYYTGYSFRTNENLKIAEEQKHIFSNDDQFLNVPWVKTLLSNDNFRYLGRVLYEWDIVTNCPEAHQIYSQVEEGKLKVNDMIEVAQRVIKKLEEKRKYDKNIIKPIVLPEIFKNLKKNQKLIFLAEKYGMIGANAYRNEYLETKDGKVVTGKEWRYDDTTGKFKFYNNIALNFNDHTTDLMEEILQNYLFETRLGYIPKEYVGKYARSNITKEYRYDPILKQEMKKVREYYEKLAKEQGIVVTGFDFTRQLYFPNSTFETTNIQNYVYPILADYVYTVKGYKKDTLFGIPVKYPFKVEVEQYALFDIEIRYTNEKEPNDYVTLVYVSKPFKYGVASDYSFDPKLATKTKVPFDPNILPDWTIDYWRKLNKAYGDKFVLPIIKQ